MPRLLASLAAAAAVLADQAADRLDTWVEHTTGTTDTTRETPLGFTPATGTDAPDAEAIINAAADRGLAGEQRARWLAEVAARLDASTGGPWCTEGRDRPTGRLISPYGVIATGVTRAADRDLIEECRTDLYGLLALAKHDDEVIEQWSKATADYAARAGEAERELGGMKARERDVEYVIDHVVDGRLALAEYVDPETPAGRVRDLIDTLLKQVREAESRAELAERKLDAHHRHDAEITTADDVRARAAERILAYAAEEKSRVNDTYGQVYLSGLETAAALIVDGEDDGADIDTDSPFLPASQARAETHLIKVALNHIDAGHDPRGVLHFNDRPLARRVVDMIMRERRHAEAVTDIDKGGAMYYAGMRDAAALAPEETIEAVKQAAAARIREAADDAERERIGYNDPFPSDADIAGGDAYIAGLRAAADLAEDKTPEADPNVAHIDTVNGRAPAADEAPDDMPVVTPGSFLEAVLNTGGTVVVDDDGVPHATDITIGNDPAAVGTIITADGKRHRFTGGTASPVDDHVIVVAEGGYGSAGAPDDDNPPPRIVLSENGYVLHVMEADDEDAPDER